MASSTITAYRSGQHCYLRFCAIYGLTPFPLNEHNLCRFVAFLSHNTLSYPTIRLYLSAVRHLQISARFSGLSLQATPRLNYVLRGLDGYVLNAQGRRRSQLPRVFCWPCIAAGRHIDKTIPTPCYGQHVALRFLDFCVVGS